MTKFVTSLPELINMMDFISEVSTLYEVETGPEFRLVASNNQAQVSGAAPHSLHGKLMKDFLPKNFYEQVLLPILNRVITDKQTVRTEHPSPYFGVERLMDALITPIIEGDKCTHIWVITKGKRMEEELEYLSSTDELTAVANRRFYYERLKKSYKRYREQDIKFGIMLIDLDNFKMINDTNGHQFGDMLLQAVSKKIVSCVRQSDLVGRLGGDEFAILVEDDNYYAVTCRIAERIVSAIQTPFSIEGSHVSITLSMGIASIQAGDSIENLLARADRALYRAKELDGSRYVLDSSSD